MPRRTCGEVFECLSIITCALTVAVKTGAIAGKLQRQHALSFVAQSQFGGVILQTDFKNATRVVRSPFGSGCRCRPRNSLQLRRGVMQPRCGLIFGPQWFVLGSRVQRLKYRGPALRRILVGGIFGLAFILRPVLAAVPRGNQCSQPIFLELWVDPFGQCFLKGGPVLRSGKGNAISPMTNRAFADTGRTSVGHRIDQYLAGPATTPDILG